MDWNLPSLTQTWANFLAALRSRDESNAKMDYTGDSNIPDGTVRWSATNKRFELWNASSSIWGVLSSSYSINVDTVDSEHASDFASAKGSTGNRQAKDADTVDGVHLPGTIGQVLTNHTKAVHDALNIDAETLDGLDSSQFLRSDADDTSSGSLEIMGNLSVNGTSELKGYNLYVGTSGGGAGGSGLITHRMDYTPAAGGWGRGYRIQKGSNYEFGVGLLGSGNSTSRAYIGIGTEPWDKGLGVETDGTLKAYPTGYEIWHSGNVASAPGLNIKKTQTGYAQLPGGITIQWGRIANGANDPTVTFPIAFPNECSSVTASHINSGPTNDAPCPSNITKTSFVLNNGGTLPCTWIAVGF